jgi:hypothetical protein
MNRYRETKQTIGRFLTSRLAYPEVRSTDYYIFSREGDRLDSLAQSFYKDVSLWWIIANANNLGKGSMLVPEGLQLRIPFPVNDIDIALEQIERER